MITPDWTRLLGGALGFAPATLRSPGQAGPDIFAGGIGNAIITLIIFVSVVVILGKYAWPSLARLLAERQETIQRSLEDARREREAAQAELRKIEERLASAREEAGAIVEQGRRGGEEVKRAAQKEARQEAEAMIERAKREIGLARDTAVKDLYDLTAMLATEAASRVIGKELDAGEHERLIAEAIAELAKGNGKGRQ